MDNGLSAVSRYILVTAAFVIIVAGMKYAAPLLIPFLLSVFIAVLCLPAIHALRQYGLNQGFSLTVVLLSVLFFGLLLSLIIGGSVNDFSATIPVYQEKLSVFNTQLVDALGVFGFVINDQMLTEYLDAGAVMKMVASIVSGFANVLANSFLIFVTVIFILLESNQFKNKLDATGLNCPLPILRAKKAINTLDAGQTLKIISTDPGSVKDFEAFCKQTGNELLSSGEEDGKFLFMIKKAA